MPEPAPATGPTQTTTNQNSNQTANGGQGAAAPTTPATPTEPARGGEPDWPQLTSQWAADGLTPTQVAERLKASRKWEQRAKDNASAASELEKLRQSQMTEQEKAVAAAREEAAAATRTEMGRDMAEARFRAAAAGRIADVDDLLQDIDISRFIGEDGRPDDKAINASIERLSKVAPAVQQPQVADLRQGARGAAPAQATPNQWMRQELSR